MSKFCSVCGKSTDDNSKFCSNCGSDSFSQAPTTEVTGTYALNGEEGAVPETDSKEKVGLGILGAFLFSLAGGILYVILYQFGILSAICGWLAFILAGVGYRKFSKTKERFSVKSIIVSAVMLVVVLLLSEYVCISIEVYRALAEEYYFTFFDALLSAHLVLADSEILRAVLSDLGFCFLFGAIAVISEVVTFFKNKKAAEAAPVTVSSTPAETENTTTEE